MIDNGDLQRKRTIPAAERGDDFYLKMEDHLPFACARDGANDNARIGRSARYYSLLYFTPVRLGVVVDCFTDILPRLEILFRYISMVFWVFAFDWTFSVCNIW